MADKKTTSYPKEKINILFLENISDAAVKHFVSSGYASVRKLSGALSEEQLVNEINDVVQLRRERVDILAIERSDEGLI